MSLEIQVLKVDSFSKISGSGPGFIPAGVGHQTKSEKSAKKIVRRRSPSSKGVSRNTSEPEMFIQLFIAVIQEFLIFLCLDTFFGAVLMAIIGEIDQNREFPRFSRCYTLNISKRNKKIKNP